MLERFGVKIDEALQLPDCPARFVHVMVWYAELARQRRQAVGGVHPLVWADMGEWARAKNQHPTPAEWEMIERLDVLFREAAARHKPAEKRGRSSR